MEGSRILNGLLSTIYKFDERRPLWLKLSHVYWWTKHLFSIADEIKAIWLPITIKILCFGWPFLIISNNNNNNIKIAAKEGRYINMDYINIPNCRVTLKKGENEEENSYINMCSSDGFDKNI